MPVDKVKIDKGLKDKFLFLENSAVMKNLISICHDLNLKVVTEGVETEAEYRVRLGTEEKWTLDLSLNEEIPFLVMSGIFYAFI
jgi:hypothetical protein